MINVERLGVVLSPDRECEAKFNAGMILEGDVVHMLYRWAEHDPDNKESVTYCKDHIRYAKLSKDGKLIKDYDAPVIKSISGEYVGFGAQDPRIVPFEGYYYIFFCDYNLKSARVGISRTKDFITYERLGTIPTLKWDKDAYIFPERINGKIAYIHRFEPDIQIDYFDTFEEMFDENYWNNYDEKIHEQVVLKGEHDWECLKIGGSIPPIKTELGWLFFYHGVSNDRDPFCYRMGACVLDYKNPSKVLARLPYPILQPDEDYEIEGDIHNVVFPQGTYILDDDMYISYGAADKYVALAKIKYSEVINELKKYPVDTSLGG